jgi:hypothetical protein
LRRLAPNAALPSRSRTSSWLVCSEEMAAPPSPTTTHGDALAPRPSHDPSLGMVAEAYNGRLMRSGTRAAASCGGAGAVVIVVRFSACVHCVGERRHCAGTVRGSRNVPRHTTFIGHSIHCHAHFMFVHRYADVSP